MLNFYSLYLCLPIVSLLSLSLSVCLSLSLTLNGHPDLMYFLLFRSRRQSGHLSPTETFPPVAGAVGWPQLRFEKSNLCHWVGQTVSRVSRESACIFKTKRHVSCVRVRTKLKMNSGSVFNVHAAAWIMICVRLKQGYSWLQVDT